MEKRLNELAAVVGGKVKGDGGLIITGVAGIAEAGPGQITFLSNPKYRNLLKSCRASALISAQEEGFKGAFLLHPHPYLAFAKVMNIFYQKVLAPREVSERAYVSPSATIGQDVCIYPFVFLAERAVVGDRVTIYPHVFIGEGVTIGDDSIIYSGVSIREGCVIGRRVIIHCGAVIGSDGFGYAREGDSQVKIPQVGNVQVDDDVEIGANVTIDRAVLGTTWVKKGVKIDNLVQIAHNVIIGENSIIVAQVGISGSSRLGKGVVLGGQVGVAGHVNIGDGVTVAGQSGVTKDVPAGRTVSGLPAVPHQSWLRAQMSFLKLPHLRKGLSLLEKRMEKIEEKLKNA